MKILLSSFTLLISALIFAQDKMYVHKATTAISAKTMKFIKS